MKIIKQVPILILIAIFLISCRTSTNKEYPTNNFEERIEKVDVEVDPQPDNNTFNVTIIYDIIGQEFPTQEYTFLLEATI